MARVFPAEILDYRSHGVPGGFLVQLFLLFADLPLPLGDLLKDPLGFLLQFLDAGLDPLLVLVGEVFHLLRRNHLPLAHRRKDQTRWRSQRRQAAVLRHCPQLFKGLLLLLLQFLDHGLPAVLEVLAFEGGAQGIAHIFHQVAHALGQFSTGPGIQDQIAGLVRLLKIVDIAEVGRDVLSRGPLPEEPPDQRVAAGAALPQRVDVVAVAPDADPEVQGRQGPRLAEKAVQLLEVAGAFEVELCGRADRSQLFGFEGLDRRHGRPPGAAEPAWLQTLR